MLGYIILLCSYITAEECVVFESICPLFVAVQLERLLLLLFSNEMMCNHHSTWSKKGK